MKLKFLVAIFLTALLGAFIARPLVQASYVTYYYGETAPGHIDIEKKVWNPEGDNWVDDLRSNDYRFGPGEEVVYRLTARNTGEIDFDKVKINDYLPDYLEHLAGDTVIEFENFKIGESRDFEIKTKVVASDQLPSESGLYCVVNKAVIEADNQQDEDAAQVCLENKVLGASIQPEAGSEIWLFVLGFLTLGAASFVLSKRK